MEKKIHVYPNKEKLVIATAEKIVNLIEHAIQENGLCNIALAGGNTPREVYTLLATNSYRDRVDWQNLHLFWGDERMVPPEHQDSNFRMVQQTLLEHINIPDDNIHRIRGEIPPEKASAEYAQLIHNSFRGNIPCFDLILLGIGEDGHTSSLFPDTDAIEECEQHVVSVFVSRLNAWRVTLTLPVLNAAREIFFLVSGISKSNIIHRIMSIKSPTKEFPATMVNPENGIVHWMLDSDAAALINKNAKEVMFP